jgi:hypothetical protein
MMQRRVRAASWSRRDEPIFVSAEGKRLRPENLSKKVLKPILEKIGLVDGFHACVMATLLHWTR